MVLDKIRSDGLMPTIETLVIENRETFLEAWNEHFGSAWLVQAPTRSWIGKFAVVVMDYIGLSIVRPEEFLGGY